MGKRMTLTEFSEALADSSFSVPSVPVSYRGWGTEAQTSGQGEGVGPGWTEPPPLADHTPWPQPRGHLRTPGASLCPSVLTARPGGQAWPLSGPPNRWASPGCVFFFSFSWFFSKEVELQSQWQSWPECQVPPGSRHPEE